MPQLASGGSKRSLSEANGVEANDRPSKLYRKDGAAISGTLSSLSSKTGITTLDAGITLEPEAPSEIGKFLHGVSSRFKSAAQLVSAIRRPLPDATGDGSYVDEKHEKSVWSSLKHLRPKDFDAIVDVISETAKGEPWNDREYLLERVIQAAVNLDQDTKAGKLVKEALLTKLWHDLPHPPKTLLGNIPSINPETSSKLANFPYKYRTPDGSYNNINNPLLGAAGTPYARTVKPIIEQRGAMPEPGLLFDSLMARKYNQKHQNKISSMLFYLASIIIHDLFHTDHADFNISATSSYLDLSPLYGNNWEEQKLMRTFQDGKLKPDCFSEKRLLGFPPGVGAILIMFNRFHNNVVDNLAQINEGGRFDKPQPSVNGNGRASHRRPVKTPEQYDEDLFQTGRLITCGLYIHIILYDYIRTILNLNRSDSQWVFDPRMDVSDELPAGVGNQVSAEFNLIYRWHSTLSEKDVKWTENLYTKLTGTDDFRSVSTGQLLQKLGEWEANIPEDPQARPFEGLKRETTSQKFNDQDLIDILVGSIEDCANSYGAQRVPEVLRSVEILGIEQSRKWNLATLNEFRQYFGLKKYHSFEEINPDEEVADALRNLYDTPDHVELYPGLVVEQGKDSKLPGSGLMGPYSVTRGILSDAVALVRGDRFYTTDYNAKNLTSWGLSEASSDPLINCGHVFYKLFLVSFPQHFQYNSIYAHYPFTVPEENKVILTALGKADMYTWDKPFFTKDPIEVKSYDACTEILQDKELYNVTWGKAMKFLMGPSAGNFMLAGDAEVNAASRKMMHDAIYISDWKQQIRDFYRTVSEEVLQENKYKLAGTNEIDVIRDFSNIIHTRFCAAMFKVPLKSKSNPRGIFTERELYLVLVAVFILVFFDVDKEHSFVIHRLAKEATLKLGKIMEGRVKEVKAAGFFNDLVAKVWPPGEDKTLLEDYGVHMIQRLLETDTPPNELVWGHMLGTLGGMVPNQSQGFAEALEYLLAGDGARFWPDIVALANEPASDETDEKLAAYMMEASRIACASAVTRRVTQDTTLRDGSTTLNLKEGDMLFLNLYSASHDPEVFPDPEEMRLDRDSSKYCQFGFGPHQCLGLPILRVAMAEVIRVVARLPNVRPAPGPQGRVKKMDSPYKGYSKYMTEDWNSYFPFPVTMKINWDDLPAETNGNGVEAAEPHDEEMIDD